MEEDHVPATTKKSKALPPKATKTLEKMDVDENEQENDTIPTPVVPVAKPPAKKKPPKKKVQAARTKPLAEYTRPQRVPLDFAQLEEDLGFTARSEVPELKLQYLTDDEGDWSDASLDFDALDRGFLNELDEEDALLFDKALIEEKGLLRQERQKQKLSRFRASNGLRRHVTGSARTEGHYAISAAEKKMHLRLIAKPKDSMNQFSPVRSNGHQNMNIRDDLINISSRANRVAYRNLSLTSDAGQKKTIVPVDSTDSLRFNQMKARKKRLKFAKSNIHDWGLFAMEKIDANEMIIEYIGEKIRQKVADHREVMYEKQGIGSSYLFRVDEDVIIDATKTGNLARFINHCCEVSLIFSFGDYRPQGIALLTTLWINPRLAQLQCQDY
jgi:hypothetical protein